MKEASSTIPGSQVQSEFLLGLFVILTEVNFILGECVCGTETRRCTENIQ